MNREECFIYYRVARSEMEGAQESVLAFQANLCLRFPGLEARLLSRVDDAQAQTATFMEIYRADRLSEGMRNLQDEIKAAAAAALPWLKSERHLEVFLPLGQRD